MKTSIATLLGLACLLAPFGFAAEMQDAVPTDASGDMPCKIISTVQPRFPVRMQKEGVVRGVARVLLHVNAEGRLVDSLVTAYTKRPFADEALRAIEKWKFEPGRSHGELIDTIVDITFNFEVNEVLLVQKFMSAEPAGSEPLQGYEYQACSLKNLDRLPVPVSVTAPTYPESWISKGIVGDVAVDFYIDETGRVRFPAAAADANNQLAGIAVAAVQKWQFTPPTSQGKPVLVRARQTFAFGRDKKS